MNRLLHGPLALALLASAADARADDSSPSEAVAVASAYYQLVLKPLVSSTDLSCADLHRSKILVPVAWDDQGKPVASILAEPESVSDIPAFATLRRCTGDQHVATAAEVANQFTLRGASSNVRLYDHDSGSWSGVISVAHVSTFLSTTSDSYPGATPNWNPLTWFSSAPAPASNDNGTPAFFVSPTTRLHIKVTSVPDDASISISGQLLPGRTTYRGYLIPAVLSTVVIKKQGYKDCLHVVQLPGSSDVTEHFDQVIRCDLVALK